MNTTTAPTPSISPSETAARVRSGRVVLLDVRTPAEFRAVHAEGAINVPLESLSSDAIQAATGSLAGREVAFLCKSGMRAGKACEAMAGKWNIPHVKVEGGTDAWIAAGLPVQRGGFALPLDRQMRLVAGTLVLAGAALGWKVDPAWYGLSAFVGAGLAFSGITGICPMMSMLARAPWNR
jgi:rhodanese-related sulfurtransferase